MKVFHDFSKPERKSIAETIFGIQATGNTVLTDIARTLAPDGGAHNAENRIGRNLMREGPDSQRPRIGQTKCNVQEFVAFNLPTVAFSLSIDLR